MLIFRFLKIFQQIVDMWLSGGFCDFHETSNHIEKLGEPFNYSRESSRDTKFK